MRLGFIDDPSFTWGDMGKAVLYLLKDQRNKYLLYTGILFTVLFYDLVPTLIIAKVVDFFTKYKTGDSLNVFYFFIVFLTVTWGIVSLVRLTIKGKLSSIQSQVAYTTKVNGFERLLDFSIKWHDSENSGNKVQKIQNGIDSLSNMQTIFSNGIFPQLTAVIGVMTAFLFINKLFFLYCLFYIITFVLIQASFYKKMLAMNYAYNSMLEKASGTYYEGLNNILTLKTLGVKNDFKKNIISREELSRDLQMKMITLGNSKWRFFQILNGLMLGGIVFLTGRSLISGIISVGSIIIIFNYFQKLAGALGESTNLLERLITVKVGISRMMPIFWEDELSKKGTRDFPKNWNSVSIKNAIFNYKNNTNTEKKEVEDRGLKDVTLFVDKYEKVGVVGKSGSGKSTFAKMLLGLYQFESGLFNIGDTNFYDIKHDQLTNEVALVLQDSEMFNLSLKDNITLMRLFDEKLFKKALEIAQLEEIIVRLPDGADTLIGEKGYRLSGGERQRIGIARAIYKDPQILVLDEATSSLDSKTENLIQEAFEKNLRKKTIISIAHRVSTLKNVDKIVVFDEGRIVEEGKFDELSKNTNSKFFEIYQHQNKEEKGKIE